MTQPEFEQILSLLDEIRLVVVDRYNTIYMPRFNALGGKQMLPLASPILWHGKSLQLSVLDEAIQKTNKSYVYQLNNVVKQRATFAQRMHDHSGFEDRVVDGINYMGLLTNEMISNPINHIPNLPYRVNAGHMIAILEAILKALQTL